MMLDKMPGFILFILIISEMVISSFAFVPTQRIDNVIASSKPNYSQPNQQLRVHNQIQFTSKNSPSTLWSSSSPDNFFDGLRNFWDGLNSNKNSNRQEVAKNNNNDMDKRDENDDEDDELPAGTTILLSIPVKQMKVGGLRLFLMFYLMGMQNTPEPKSWRAADQPVKPITMSSIDDDSVSSVTSTSQQPYILEMLFHDATAMIQIELFENSNEESNDGGGMIRILRCGSRPSTQYLMQESVIVDGVLDELSECAFDEKIAVQDRLLIPEPASAIDTAREVLAFR